MAVLFFWTCRDGGTKPVPWLSRRWRAEMAGRDGGGHWVSGDGVPRWRPEMAEATGFQEMAFEMACRDGGVPLGFRRWSSRWRAEMAVCHGHVTVDAEWVVHIKVTSDLSISPISSTSFATCK